MDTTKTKIKLYLPMIISNNECIMEKNKVYNTLEEAKKVLIDTIKYDELKDRKQELLEMWSKFYDIYTNLNCKNTTATTGLIELCENVDELCEDILCLSKHCKDYCKNVEELISEIKSWSGEDSTFQYIQGDNKTQFIIYKLEPTNALGSKSQ